jgi:hypothetical protein
MNTDGTAKGSELKDQVSPARDFKGDARLLLFTHGALLVVLAYLFLGYIPQAFNGFYSGPPFPRRIRLVLNLAEFLNSHALFMTPILPLTLWADARGYHLCCTRYGRGIGRCWFGSGVGLLAVIIIYCLWGLGAIVRI